MTVTRSEMESANPLVQSQSLSAVSGRDRAVIVDAGVGNLGNVERALRHLRPDLEILVTSDPDAVGRSGIVVLPGVGAFRPPRESLRGAMEDAIRATVDDGAYLLGICVGFQLLFQSSEEFGETDGLGYFPGSVKSLPTGNVMVPHIGWNRLLECQAHPLMAGVDDCYAYFVHSFAPSAVPQDLVLASCRHGSLFPAVVARGRVMGAQFHPEKSGAMGLRFLDNFLRIAGVESKVRR